MIDVSSPRRPVKVSAYDTPGYAYDVHIAGQLALVADGKSGLRIINVSNPSAPREIASYKTPGYAEEISIGETISYVANYDAGLAILALKPEWGSL